MVVLNLSQLQCCVFRWRVLITILMYTMGRWTDATNMENEITSLSVCQCGMPPIPDVISLRLIAHSICISVRRFVFVSFECLCVVFVLLVVN